MKARTTQQIHTLEIPLQGTTLLIPSASVAEVINPVEVSAIPFSEPWLLGVIGWRSLAVPVVSLDLLMGKEAAAPRPGSKIVVLYPLSGRQKWEFFAVVAYAEPRPQSLNGSETAASASDLPPAPFIAAGLKLGDKVMAIPDIEALKAVFYPG